MEAGLYSTHLDAARHLIPHPRQTVITPAELLIRQLIAASSRHWVSFAQVMELALYHPDHGYYAHSPRRIGRAGDFFTAVSVGPLYGRLLAQVAVETWERLGCPPSFTLIEQGAHDGQLAADVWEGLQSHALGAVARYLIVEPQAAYREAQQQRLGPLLGERLAWVENLSGLGSDPAHALFLCNELLDAFPVHRVRWNGQAWEELGVVLDEHDALGFGPQPITDLVLAEELTRLPADPPAGYTTEVHPAATQWLRSLAATSFKGALMMADYGHEQAEYYAPERSEGTVRRYQQHRMDGDILGALGLSDLTAHINFTQVIAEAERGGFVLERFMEQGRFLTHLAKPWLASLEGRPPTSETMALLRQFQTLTHPSHMGVAFRMLLMAR